MNYLKHKNYPKLSPRSHKLVLEILRGNPWLKQLFDLEDTYEGWRIRLNAYCNTLLLELSDLQNPSGAWKVTGIERILDYLQYSDLQITDPYRAGDRFMNDPFGPLWRAVKLGMTEGGDHYFRDMLHLFNQVSGELPGPATEAETLHHWMSRHPSGLDKEIVEIRLKNKQRIIGHLIEIIDEGSIPSKTFRFPDGLTREQKKALVNTWWDTKNFHLKFAVRDPELLNKMLDYSLSESTMRILRKAREEGIPFFINTYYLSLLNTNECIDFIGSDLAIREYIIYNKDIIEEYGNIEAWEKEDQVIPGMPNAAGWILPFDNNLHRRYPEVAIMIPDTLGRTCGGLCVSCQRMYEFQSGGLNFNLDRKIAYEDWGKKLEVIMQYFAEDKQLRDILITGGDALMSRDIALEQIFDAVLQMVSDKQKANRQRPEGEKYAGISRIRLGTRLPAYLPQRVTEELVTILRNFRQKGLKAGIRQFVIQTHFESAMEVTPEATRAVQMLTGAGWLVTNQHVFTVASSRRGHMAKLRATLAKIGVMPYYTFSVKGFLENRHNFATHARLMQEKHEEKIFGAPTREIRKTIMEKASRGQLSAVEIALIMKQQKIPFIASDRSMMNLPGIGKSMTFRTIGITPDGRRILKFDYDHSRRHSPVIDQSGKVIIVESKPVGAYLSQIEKMGENPAEYISIFGYSKGESEKVFPLFAYPEYPYQITHEINHFAHPGSGRNGD